MPKLLRYTYFHSGQHKPIWNKVYRRYQAGWKQEPEEERAKIHLYEVKLEDENPQKCDMLLYDEAYDAMSEKQDVAAVLSCARKYFSGEYGPAPVWEIMSDKPAVAVKDISHFLKSVEE